jgi:biotin synthase-related radical SAM superfamily protein
MENKTENSTLRRLKSHYRLVILNEDSYEEVMKMKLTRTSVYVFFSSIFVLIMGLTAFLIIFTPLKYYLPGVGYGNAAELRAFKELKVKTDSMEHVLDNQTKYIDNISKVLKGEQIKIDTTALDLPVLPEADE